MVRGQGFFAGFGLALAFVGELESVAVLRLQRSFWGSNSIPAIAVTWLILLTAFGAAGFINPAFKRGTARQRGAATR